jgi:ribosomal protein S18 acetylase RimI-like enzyme
MKHEIDCQLKIDRWDGDDNFDPDPSYQDFKIKAIVDGKQVGYALVVHVGSVIRIYEAEVDKKYRRNGISTLMYDHAEKLTGKISEPYDNGDGEVDFSDDGTAFWKSRQS